MISIVGDISKNQYDEVMKWAMDNSDTIMFVFRGFDKVYWNRMKLIRKKLASHRIYTRHVPREWPGTKLLGTSKYQEPLHIDFYKISPEISQYVLGVGHLYGWSYPNEPEDISSSVLSSLQIV